MFAKLLFAVMMLSLSASAAMAQDASARNTVVRCTQNSATQGRYRYNVRIFHDAQSNLFADIHKVEAGNNFGRSIFVGPVLSAVASRNPLVVTFWTSDNALILKVPARYVRGSSIIDYSGPGVMASGGVNYYMNCFTVVH